MRYFPTICVLLAALFLLALPTKAEAACSSPAGVAGAIIYNANWHVPQYCNNTNWIGMGKATNATPSFSYIVTTPTNSNSTQSIWGDGTYIYVADNFGGIDAYTFNGTAFTFKATNTTNSTDARGVWGDGTYIYVADGNSNTVDAYSFNGTAFTYLASVSTGAFTATDVWGDGTYIYAVAGSINAYTFNGTAFTFKAASASAASGVWGDGTYIYASNDLAGVYAYTFDGTSFTLKASSNTNSTNSRGVWADGTYVYVADYNGGIDAYTFNGTAFTFKATNTANSSTAVGVWGNGSYIFVADSAGGIDAYTFNGTSFTFKATNTANSTNAQAVWGDGTYIFGADGLGGGGVDAYQFSCSSPYGGEGDIRYNADNRVMQYCNGVAWQAMGRTYPIKFGMEFDGSTYLTRGAALTGDSDVKTATVSLWFRRGSFTSWFASPDTFFESEGSRFRLSFGPSGTGYNGVIYIYGISGGGSGTVQLDMKGGYIFDQNWHHLALSFNMADNSATGRYLYIDGQPQTLTVTTYNDAVIDFTRTNHALGAYTTGGNPFKGDIAEFYMNRSFMDLSNENVLQKFRNKDGTPADLGSTCQNPTGTTPIVCFTDKTAAAWKINKGSGGPASPTPWTETGTLTKSVGQMPGLSCTHETTPLGFAKADTASSGALWSDGSYLYSGGSVLRAYDANSADAFILKGSYTLASGSITGLWGDGTYIYASVFDTTNRKELRAYSFDGSTFTEVAAIGSYWAYDIWGDGTYIYLAKNINGQELEAYTFNGTAFTQVGVYDVSGTTGLDGLWGDGTYVYTAGEQGVLRAYTFNGSTFTPVGSVSTARAEDVWGDGTYIYSAGAYGGLKAYSFNGTTFTLLASASGEGYISKVSGEVDGTYIYAVGGSNFYSYTFDGSAFTLKGVFTDASFSDVRPKGAYVYTASSSEVRAYVRSESIDACDCPPRKVLTQIASGSVGSMTGGLWHQGGYFFVTACSGSCPGSSDLKAYKRTGSTFTQQGSSINVSPTSAGDVWGDGTYIYVADYSTSTLKAYSFDGTSFTLRGTVATTSSSYYVWGDATYIYSGAGCCPTSIKAFTFNGTTFTQVGTTPDIFANRHNLETGGGYIYRGGDSLQAWTFNGTTFTQVGNLASSTGTIGVGDGYIYAVTGGNLSAYTFNGTTFTLAASIAFTGSLTAIWSMYPYVIAATWNDGLKAYYFDGTSFTFIDSITGDYRLLWGDGSYIYAMTGGSLRGYDPTAALGPAGKEGTFLYNSAFNKLQYCNGTIWQDVGR